MHLNYTSVKHTLSSCAMIVIGCLSVLTAHGQQQVQFTQYMFNGLVLNPAYAGADEALNVTFYNRSQWAGIDGAPKTQTLSGHTLFKNQHIGLGLMLLHDKIGIHRNLNAGASVAYHLPVAKGSSLSMGIQFSYKQNAADYASLLSNLTTDPNIYNVQNSESFLDLGIGFYYRSSKLHVGLSAPGVLPGKLSINDTLAVKLNSAHYLLFSKYRFPINAALEFEPGFLIKYLPGVPISFDLNASVVIRQALTIGTSYRKSESIALLVKAQVTSQLQLGYGYDHTVGKVSRLSGASHELMVNYLFKYKETKVASPR